MDKKYAPFHSRVIASLIDLLIFLPIVFYLLSLAAGQQRLAEVVYYLILILVLALSPLGLIHHIIFIKFFGGTIGKLLTGISIQQIDGEGLSWKRIFFRQMIGYTFSLLFFGLGYLAMFKHERRQTWHDQVVGSVVVIRQPIWIIGLLFLIGLLVLNGWLIGQAMQKAVSNTAVQQETLTIVEQLRTLSRDSEQESSTSATEADSPSRELLFTEDWISKQNQVYSSLDQKNYQMAQVWADRMRAEAKTNEEKALTHQVMGELYINQGNYVKAKESLMESLTFSDRLPMVHEGLAVVHIEEKNYQKAQQYALRATQFDEPRASSYYILGLTYFYLKDTEQAKSQIQKAIELDPQNDYYKEELAAIKKQK